MIVSYRVIAWMPLIAVLFHLVEEIGACSAAWHAWATIERNEYSPGVVTACALYIPLAMFGFVHFARSGIVRPLVVVEAALIGPAFHLFSAWNHRRRAAKNAAPRLGANAR
jgi:hypothetical protein